MTGIEYGVEVPTNNGVGIIACTDEAHATNLLALLTGARLVARVTGPWESLGVVHAEYARRDDWEATLIIGNQSDISVCDVEVRKSSQNVWLVPARSQGVDTGFAFPPNMADQVAVALARGAAIVRKEQESQ